MALLTVTERTRRLRALGFRGSLPTMVRNFQKGWNLGTALTVDGIYGFLTDSALRKSYSNALIGRPTASAHFSFSEFRCKCYGKYASCQGVVVLRTHIRRLELYRSKLVRGISIVSGYRCYYYNRAVGGASNSQHLYGAASDISPLVAINTLVSWRLFAGLGYGGRTGRVLHVDSRDISGNNTTGGIPSRPTKWVYSSW